MIISCEQLDKLLIESANGDAFGDLVEHMLRPLSWCSFICDIKIIENQWFDGGGDAHDDISSCFTTTVDLQ